MAKTGQHADSQIAFGKTVAQQKRMLPVSDDLPAKVYLVKARELRAEAKMGVRADGGQ